MAPPKRVTPPHEAMRPVPSYLPSLTNYNPMDSCAGDLEGPDGLDTAGSPYTPPLHHCGAKGLEPAHSAQHVSA